MFGIIKNKILDTMLDLFSATRYICRLHVILYKIRTSFSQLVAR